MNGNVDFYSYWGKAHACENNRWVYHLLVYHCLDVASVGEIWLKKNSQFIEDISNFCGISIKTIREWLLLFIALHDVGKFSIGFQNLCPDILEELQGYKDLNIPYKIRHDQTGYCFYQNYLFEQLYQDNFERHIQKKISLKEFFDLFAFIAFGHHGIPPKNEETDCVMPAVVNEFFKDLFNLFISDDAIEEVISLFQLEKIRRKEKVAALREHTWQLAGFVTLCDWIASGDDIFGYSADRMNLDSYFSGACIKADTAIDKAGVVSLPISKVQGISRLFPQYVSSPTPLQAFCDRVSVKKEPQLWILEDLTGAGKTEAALILASRLLYEGNGTGCYIALPTMATSNAMYERMTKVYSYLYEDNCRPSLVLCHGARHLSETYQKSYKENFSTITFMKESGDEDRNEGGAHCSQWLADSSKKALLADVGVGTIDQLLLAGLPVRYQSLRAFGMGQKVLIIDEVHAFDAYMLRLLESIIAAQAAFGGSVILLSATLPFSVREKLCTAFLEGIKIDTPILLQEKGFPLVTAVTASNVLEQPVNARFCLNRTVEISFCEAVEDIYLLIEEYQNKGQCVCWIRNTVSDILTAYNELQKRGIDRIGVFHSRFALHDRLTIENRICKQFGKKSTPEYREGQILLATQVVEQSLDLDFDIMISDLAPVDLLIQRAGRLHRHERGQRESPVFYIHIPPDTDYPTADWYAESFPHARWVYRDTAILWRTKEILKQHRRFNMPEDTRYLIESVYGEDSELDVPQVFFKSEDEAWADKMSKSSIADFNRLRFEYGYSRKSNDYGKWEKEEIVSTRLSDKTRMLYLCKWENDELLPLYEDERYPWDLSSLTIREAILSTGQYGSEVQNSIIILQRKKGIVSDSVFLIFKDGEIVTACYDKNNHAVNVKYSQDKGLLIESKEDHLE